MYQLLGKSVGPIGYGLMGLTWRPQPPSMEDAFAAMKKAIECGCTLWNVGEFYGTPEYNSMTLLNAYFTKYPEDAKKVVVNFKGAHNMKDIVADSSPKSLRKSIDNILKQLDGKVQVDEFECARRDPKVPLEGTLSIIQKEYVDTGKVRSIALSECSAETIHEAVRHVKVSSVEVELSLFSPDVLQNGIAAACANYGITLTAYSPLGHGMLTGNLKNIADLETSTMKHFPRFQAGAFEHNVKLVQKVEEFAQEKGCTPAQLAINWVRELSSRPGMPTIIPIPGATTAARVEENSKIIHLSDRDMEILTEMATSFEVSGGRYPDQVPVNT